jgi:hypothetical protein
VTKQNFIYLAKTEDFFMPGKNQCSEKGKVKELNSSANGDNQEYSRLERTLEKIRNRQRLMAISEKMNAQNTVVLSDIFLDVKIKPLEKLSHYIDESIASILSRSESKEFIFLIDDPNFLEYATNALYAKVSEMEKHISDKYIIIDDEYEGRFEVVNPQEWIFMRNQKGNMWFLHEKYAGWPKKYIFTYPFFPHQDE